MTSKVSIYLQGSSVPLSLTIYTKIPVDPIHFDQYDIARRWEKISEGRWLTGRGLRGRNMPPEQLFLERSVEFIKPGTGRMAIVLPDDILSNPDLEYIRFWILKNTQILASIDMPQEAFHPWTGTQTSVLFLRRTSPEEIRTEELTAKMQDYDVFMAMVEKVGHDRGSNVIYKRDPEGNEIMVEADMVIRQVDDRGLVTVRKERVQQKIVNDQLPLISQAFPKWQREKGRERSVSLVDSVAIAEEILEERALKVNSVNTRWLRHGALRLDAGPYAEQAFAAHRTVTESGFNIISLETATAHVFNLARFKRAWTTHADTAYPYLSASKAVS